jgi:hypothetical protein
MVKKRPRTAYRKQIEESEDSYDEEVDNEIEEESSSEAQNDEEVSQALVLTGKINLVYERRGRYNI